MDDSRQKYFKFYLTVTLMSISKKPGISKYIMTYSVSRINETQVSNIIKKMRKYFNIS